MLRHPTLAVVAALALSAGALAQESAAPMGPEATAEMSTEAAASPPAIETAVPPPTVEIAAPATKPSQFWFEGQYLLGFVRGDTLPPLVTTSPAGTPRASAGVLGQPGTTVLIGLRNENTGGRSGFQFDDGYWFTPERVLGLETDFFLLSQAHRSQTLSSTGTPILARPFFDVTTGAESSALIAFPGVSTGNVTVSDSAHTFWGYDVDLRENMWSSSWYRFDSLFGYRYMRYDEALTITQNVQPTGGVFVAGTNIESVDNFITHNVFNGADMGMRGQITDGPWALDLLAKVAVGVTEHTVNINGSQTTTVPGAAPVTSEGGLLALSSNIGHHLAYDYTAIPEFGVGLAWQIRPYMRVDVGYSAMWWFNVARPGQQVDLNVNPGLIPPATGVGTSSASPMVTNQRTDLWLQALHVGFEFKY